MTKVAVTITIIISVAYITLGKEISLNWPVDYDDDTEYRKCKCYSTSGEDCKNEISKYSLSYKFPTIKDCREIASQYCSDGLKYYSQYMQSNRVEIDDITNLMRSAFCFNKCLNKYIDNGEFEEKEKESFKETMILLGKIDEDINSHADALIQMSGSRQKFRSYISAQAADFSFPGFKSFLRGFKDAVSTISGAVNIISQITQEKNKYIDKVIDLVTMDYDENSNKIGPMMMINYQVAGEMLREIVRSNSASHKRINKAYFKYSKPYHMMDDWKEQLCMREIAFSSILYNSVNFTKWSELDPEQGPMYSIPEYIIINNSETRIGPSVTIQKSNTTECNPFENLNGIA